MRLVREALEEHKVRCELIIVADGESAIDFVAGPGEGQRARPDLIILDLNLPRKTGKEVLERIRASSTYRHVPVVILTSSESFNDRQDAVRLGASRYVRKPSHLEQFLELGRIFGEMLAGDSL
jgi:CheY-like chemotaxis protein